jgi:hypothetical protein
MIPAKFSYSLECDRIEDFQQINYPILWGGQHERPVKEGAHVAHPTGNS